MPPLPHHRAYGSVSRRFGGLSARQRLHGKQSKTFEALVGEGPMQCARRTQSPWSFRTEDGCTGHLLRDIQVTKFFVASAARLPLRLLQKTGQVAKRESSLGTAVWPEVRLVAYT